MQAYSLILSKVHHMFIIIFNSDSIEFSTTKLFKTWSNSYTIALNILKPAWYILTHPRLFNNTKSATQDPMVWEISATIKYCETSLLDASLLIQGFSTIPRVSHRNHGLGDLNNNTKSAAWFGRSQHDKTKQTIFLNEWNGWNDKDSLSCMSHEWIFTARGKMIFSCNEKKNIYDIEGFLKT